MRTDVEICKENKRDGRELGRKARREITIWPNTLTDVMKKILDVGLDGKIFMQMPKTQ